MKKISFIIVLSILFALNANAGSSGDQKLSKKENGTVKDCFEGLNRGVFAFNKALDNILFEPIAKGYRVLPLPIRSGAGNALRNLSNVVTIPNNILQGEIKKAGNNTARLAINTTIGILGLFDPAAKLGFEKLDKEDYYYSKDGYIIFTEQYHLKRGYCCRSGCKHCPYGYDKKTDTIKNKF